MFHISWYGGFLTGVVVLTATLGVEAFSRPPRRRASPFPVQLGATPQPAGRRASTLRPTDPGSAMDRPAADMEGHMPWNEKRATDRVANNDFHDQEVNVGELKRTTDFANLSKKDVRWADGAHVYSDIPNFHEAVGAAGNDQQKLRKVVRAASVLRRMEAAMEREFDVGHLQFQGARQHGLVYKPYNDEAKRAIAAIKFAITVNTFVEEVFNVVFEEVTDFAVASGIASGRSLIANVGHHGARELISLGTCANVAAKMLSTGETITITQEIYDVLEPPLKDEFKRDRKVADVQTYQASGLRWTTATELAEALDVSFDASKWTKKAEDARDALPLSDIKLSEAEVRIDLDALTERNCKRTSLVAIYADIDGFTKLVQTAEDDEAVVSLVRKLNMIRAEFHAVAKTDYEGVVLQHQGDRMFAILHMPGGDDGFAKRCRKGLEIAIGIQSSMIHVLKDHLGEAKELKVAVGLEIGPGVVTRLGKQGEREPVCLGKKVSAAEELQLSADGREIRISKTIYDEIADDNISEEFEAQDDGSYSATWLTFPRLGEKADEKAARANSLSSSGSGPLIKVTRDERQHPVPNANRRPYSAGG